MKPSIINMRWYADECRRYCSKQRGWHIQKLTSSLSGKWDWEERMKGVARHVDKESREFEMVNLLQSLKDKLTEANLKSLNDFSEILDTCISISQ
jgi:hypothetical protein